MKREVVVEFVLVENSGVEFVVKLCLQNALVVETPFESEAEIELSGFFEVFGEEKTSLSVFVEGQGVLQQHVLDSENMRSEVSVEPTLSEPPSGHFSRIPKTVFPKPSFPFPKCALSRKRPTRSCSSQSAGCFRRRRLCCR